MNAPVFALTEVIGLGALSTADKLVIMGVTCLGVLISLLLWSRFRERHHSPAAASKGAIPRDEKKML
jgi:hypothetical protein